VKAPVYDTLKDFVPVAHAGSYEVGLAVGAGVPVNDFREWVSWVKADKKNATYGSPGAGTNLHFLGLMVAQMSGVTLVHVPYRGSGPVVADLLGGQVPTVMLPLSQITQHTKGGKARLLAHAGRQRVATAPETPTFKELGYPALEVSGWYCVIAPAGMRPDLLARYNEIVIQAQRTPAIRERMRTLDLEIREMTPSELVAKFKTEYDRWGPIVKASGFSADSQ
jgi:tripartite-type tricarboxylate transporter receptor subunit TctC